MTAVDRKRNTRTTEMREEEQIWGKPVLGSGQGVLCISVYRVYGERAEGDGCSSDITALP